jgi:hypothetical protein
MLSVTLVFVVITFVKISYYWLLISEHSYVATFKSPVTHVSNGAWLETAALILVRRLQLNDLQKKFLMSKKELHFKSQGSSIRTEMSFAYKSLTHKLSL